MLRLLTIVTGGAVAMLALVLAAGCVDPASVEIEHADVRDEDGAAVADVTLTNKSAETITIPGVSAVKAIDQAGVATPADDECSTLDDTPPWTLDNTDWALYPEVEPGASHTGTICFPGIASEQIEYVVLEDNDTYLIEPVGADAASVEIRITARRLADGRIEFGVQQRDGDGWSERILPRSRYFPTSSEGRWLSSSPIEVTD